MSDRHPMNTIRSSYRGCRTAVRKDSFDRPNLGFGEPNIKMSFSSMRSAVTHGVLAIFKMCRPPKIIGGVVPVIPVFVRDLMLWRRFLAMERGADKRMNIGIFATLAGFGRRHHRPVRFGVSGLLKDLSSRFIRRVLVCDHSIQGPDPTEAARLVARISWYRSPFFGYSRISQDEVPSRWWSGALGRLGRLSIPLLYPIPHKIATVQ